MIKLGKNKIDIGIETPSFDRLIRCLSALPQDEIYETDEVVSKAGIGIDTMWRHRKKLSPYRYRATKKIYWGHPKAIEEFKRRLATL